MVHAEHLRHRMQSFSVQSSRAMPIPKMIEQVLYDPVIPVYWGKNRAGMEATEELTDRQKNKAERLWLEARDRAVVSARMMYNLSTNDLDAPDEDAGVGVHKQIVNRLLEPWMWSTVVCSATDWENFFHLRCAPDAQPEIQKIAVMMEELYRVSSPTPISYRHWHLPFIKLSDRLEIISTIPVENESQTTDLLKRIASARCGRASYLSHLGERELSKDIALCDDFIKKAHWSPLEHVATPSSEADVYIGNFKGWMQFRKQFPYENYTG